MFSHPISCSKEIERRGKKKHNCCMLIINGCYELILILHNKINNACSYKKYSKSNDIDRDLTCRIKSAFKIQVHLILIQFEFD